MAKRRRVPEVLWRMFSSKARTLSETIVSLIPLHCVCNGGGKCLRCVFGGSEDAAISYLIRPDDPEYYRQLMINCFVVIPADAPPLSPFISFSLRWSQPQLVERTIQMFLSKQGAASNVICNGYAKFKMLSSIAKLLTCSIWDMAWKRVGDSLMDYLLMYTLIFMLVRPNGHQQITGPPVNSPSQKFPIQIPGPDSEPSIHAKLSGHQKKRRRTDGNDSLYKGPSHNLPFKTAKLGNSPASEGQCNEELDVHRRKRVRLPSWQRRKRCEVPMLQNTNNQEHPTKVLSDKGALHTTLQLDLSSNEPPVDIESTSNRLIDNHSGANVRSERLMTLLCPCCSAFQSLSPVPRDAHVKRTSMFYNIESSAYIFPKGHVVNSLKPGFAGASELLRCIFSLSSMEKISMPASCFHNREFCSHRSSCLYHSLIKLLKVFLHRAKRCQHLRLLKKHCSVQPSSWFTNTDTDSTLQRSKLEAELISSRKARNQEENQQLKRSLDNESREVIQKQFGLSEPYSLKNEVVSFVWAVCRSIVPPQLLGEPSTQRILRKNISRFVKLRRFEKFSLMQCVHRLEKSKLPVLANKHCLHTFPVKHQTEQIHRVTPTYLPIMNHSSIKQILFEKWIFWFFAHIVVPLIQANFYVTEREDGKQNLYHYRKSVWKKLTSRVAMQLEGHIYLPLCDASVRSLLSKRSFGFSKVRLCPKETGARPIANLKASSRLGNLDSHSNAQLPQKKKGRLHDKNREVSYFKSVNTVLRDLHIIFTDMRMNEPEKWGSSVSSYDDVYRMLRSFLKSIKKEQEVMPYVYIVVSDVKKAFDTVSQDKLLSIVNEMQMTDKYTLEKCCEIFCRKNFFWAFENLKLVTDTRFTAMTTLCQGSCHKILVNQDYSKTLKAEELKFILEEHLKCNVLKFGRQFFKQIVGIPQGSILSSLLCSLYYGHLERNAIFPLLEKGVDGMLDEARDNHAASEATQGASFSSPNFRLLRFVDDFLFLSTSKKQAVSFFSRMQRGFREYNCYMNLDKFGTNFDTGMHGLDSKRLIVGADGVSFLCWNGLLINTCSLEVQVDYTRYLHDHLSSTLTVIWEGSSCLHLKAKLCAYIRPKCHPIFFDATINSPATIRLNVYQAFVLCAMKFHCYVCELSSTSKLRTESYFTSIEGSIRYMYNLMKRRMYGINRGSDCKAMLQIHKNEVKWLGFTAYVRVLMRKQARYKALLCLLRAELQLLSRVVRPSLLKYAIDDSHSSLLWKIKY